MPILQLRKLRLRDEVACPVLHSWEGCTPIQLYTLLWLCCSCCSVWPPGPCPGIYRTRRGGVSPSREVDMWVHKLYYTQDVTARAQGPGPLLPTPTGPANTPTLPVTVAFSPVGERAQVGGARQDSQARQHLLQSPCGKALAALPTAASDGDCARAPLPLPQARAPGPGHPWRPAQEWQRDPVHLAWAVCRGSRAQEAVAGSAAGVE